MIRCAFFALFSMVLASSQSDQIIRFTSVDVFIDAQGQPLGAYQVEFIADPQRVTLVGVEGGEHPAFAEPPYYDPKALRRHRVIVAAFSTADELPDARTRVARLHLRVEGADEPDYSAKLHVAGNPEGEPIAAEAIISKGAP